MYVSAPIIAALEGMERQSVTLWTTQAEFQLTQTWIALLPQLPEFGSERQE